jgi:ABC-type molybdate transport system ATPase subunit
MITEETLIGNINSIYQQGGSHILIEFLIAGVSFNCKITRKEMEEQRLLPGDKIYVNIDSNKICWI